MSSKTKKPTEATLSWQDEATFELKIRIPADKIKEAYKKALEEVAKTKKINGFRRGKAPLKLVEEKTDKNTLWQKVVEKIVPEAYLEAIKQHKLNPIVEPKITLEKAEMGKDWLIKAVSCQTPKVDLNNYKEEIKKLNAKDKIWTPENAVKKTREKEDQEERLQKILQILLKKTRVKIPQLLLEKETEERLISLIDQLQKAGITLEQFLARTGRTIEQLKQEYKKQAEERWKLEFVLAKIAEEERIQVSQEEIQNTVRKQPQQTNPYLLAQLLRRQKTLEYLTNL